MSPFLVLALLSSGLFLGWNLGANDAGNFFGAAVGSGMLRFRTAAFLGAIFVVVGAFSAAGGESGTLERLGNVSSLPAAFTIALAAGAAVLIFTRLRLPVSTSQAVVGSIIGWNLFSRQATDWSVLGGIASAWIFSVLLAMAAGFLLSRLMRGIIRHSRIHLFYQDAWVRGGLALAGALGAYSLGANNVANVMGVFLARSPFPPLELGFAVVSPAQILYFLGGLAMAAGILSYSQKVMRTMGSGIVHLSPENALAAVLSVSLVMLLFSSDLIIKVPVSSSQAAVGAIMGIGLSRNGSSMSYRTLGRIVWGWMVSPVSAAALSFLLLNILQNLFLVRF